MKKQECNKEFKVKIEQIKCTRYKTFQPDSPTKKVMFSNEIQNLHKLKLLSEDSSDQNKATTMHNIRQDKRRRDKRRQDLRGQDKIIKGKQEPEKQEPEEQEPEEQEPEEEEDWIEIPQARTGKFRDNIRRIDLVLVVKDDGLKPINDMKNDFLSCILRAGLEVEVEPGVMKVHKNLIFIKIHAQDSILEKYGKYFGTKRYFADTRYDYMDCRNKYEKEWLRFVRKNYKTPYGYSNYERSIIVYKILLHLSFGDNANYYGLERLLNRKIILDVFALHDGPYFITPDQTISESNARQILNYYWSSIQNIFAQQPIHLIHEYFGPRLAFYFAFYEFFTIALLVPAFLGILSTILGWINLTQWEQGIEQEICSKNDKMCTQSYTYRGERPCKDYCLSAKMHLILDYMYIPLYSFFIVVGSFIFVRLWQRREYFLKWIWEVGRHNLYYKNAIRPLFDIGSGPRTEPFIGELKYRESVIPIFFRNIISKIIIILYWYSIVPLMLKINDKYRKFYWDMILKIKKPKQYNDYVIMSVFQTFYILLMTVFEKIYHHIVYFIVKCENHSSDKKFNKSIVIKKIGFKMLYQYAFMAYYAWIFGRHVSWRQCFVYNLSPYNTYLYIMKVVYGYNYSKACVSNVTYCFPYSCIIEVGTLLATLLIVTQVLYKMFDYILYLRTDYNQCTYKKSNIPCWEREYRLSSWTEEDMVRKYINLAAQFTLVTWFVIAFPLGPLILFVMNVWHIRHEARKLLLASRRPLLIRTPGTQMNNVFYFIAFVAIITNALNISCITRTGLRYMLHKINKSSQVFLKSHYYYSDFNCYVPDIFRNFGTDGMAGGAYYTMHYGEKKRYFMMPEYMWLIIYRYWHCIIFVLATSCFLPIIFYAIPHHSQEVKKTRVIEERMINLYHNYEYKQNEYESVL